MIKLYLIFDFFDKGKLGVILCLYIIVIRRIERSIVDRFV